jgi:hypothetical protein
MLTDEQNYRLNVALQFLETLLEVEQQPQTAISDFAWAAHSYIQSVTLPDYAPSAEAQALLCKLQASNAIAEAKRNAP